MYEFVDFGHIPQLVTLILLTFASFLFLVRLVCRYYLDRLVLQGSFHMDFIWFKMSGDVVRGCC